MTREEAIAIIHKEYLCVDRDCDIERSCGKCDLMMPNKEPILQAYKLAIKALEQEPCDDMERKIEKEYLFESLCEDLKKLQTENEKLRKALEQEPYNFAKWVATEIFDENWEYNKDAFAEIACRKLAKLGIVRANGDEWELVEPQERQVQDADSD